MTDAVVTHAHDDRIGGLNTLYKYGVKVHSTKLTADFARQQGYDLARRFEKRDKAAVWRYEN